MYMYVYIYTYICMRLYNNDVRACWSSHEGGMTHTSDMTYAYEGHDSACVCVCVYVCVCVCVCEREREKERKIL